MHLVFERSKGRFKSNCNILALAWTPYYNETKFRLALFDYHQKQLINLTSSIANSNEPRVSSSNINSNNNASPARAPANQARANPPASGHLNSRMAELHQRHAYLKNATNNSNHANHQSGLNQADDQNAATSKANYQNPAGISEELDAQYGRIPDFGWLVVGNVGKIVGVTLTSTVAPPLPAPSLSSDDDLSSKRNASVAGHEEDLMQFHEEPSREPNQSEPHTKVRDTFRPDDGTLRNNYNLRGHLDEVILVKWNELYQKLATVDSKGNVLIWCKINEKFTIQTPFYNRTKTVADFKWSNDGKTALICYTDSFILVGSSSGQRHWHSMLNLDDYHITCASWTPNDEQLLLGVSNGNVVVIDLPRSELTELVVNQTNIRTMCWSSSYLSLNNLGGNIAVAMSPDMDRGADMGESSSSSSARSSSYGRHSTVVNHRRLSRDCPVFSRYRFCSQAPSNVMRARNPLGTDGSNAQSPEIASSQQNVDRTVFTFRPSIGQTYDVSGGIRNEQCDNKQQRNILAIDFANNTIKLYDGGLDDPEPRTIQVNQESYIMHWSGDGKYLAVAGFNIHTTAPSVGCLRCRYLNSIKFFDQRGQLIYEHTMRYTRYPITAFTWAHNDERLFVATGPRLHCAKVFLGIPPLSLLAVSCFQQYTKIPDKGDILDMIIGEKFISSSVINWKSHNCPININESMLHHHHPHHQQNGSSALISPEKLLFSKSSKEENPNNLARPNNNDCNNSNVYQYQLPVKLQIKIDQLFTQTIRQPFDEHWSLNDIIWHVPKNEQRYYCTLVCYTSDRDINSSGYQYRTNLIDRTSDNHTSDQNKIFVLYVEFQGSLIPILRARRVGFLKPEFVIFDPEDGQAKLHRQRKVSDISQQSFLNGFMRRRLEENYQLSNQSADYQSTYTSTPFHYSNESLVDNCSELHLYSEPRASGSSLGRQSMSDAEHYYNFDGDALRRQQNLSHPVTSNNRLADLVSDRSHHQEPVALPIMSNPYLLYMMSLSAGHEQIQGYRTGNVSQSPMVMGKALPGNKRGADRYKLRSSSGAAANLTESNELIRIKSNIWGTKFKLINLSNRMIKQRSVLGSVAYKASILHLQPRQIFLTIKDMSNYCCLCSKHHHTRSQRRLVNLTNRAATADISLFDMPNPGRPLMTPVRGKRTRKSQEKCDQHDDDGKIVLAVGDNIRVAPKLERNQRYRFAGSLNQNDNQVSGKLRDEGRLYFDGTRNSSNSSGGSGSKHRSRPVMETGGSAHGRSNVLKPLTYRYPSSGSHSNTHEVLLDKNRSGIIGSKQQTSSSTRNISDQQDDILTLSLGQGDQVRVEMSSLGNLEAPDTLRSMVADTGGRPSGGSATGVESSEALDKFLATNKTLKSIQTITKMIVDLSSKADDLEDGQQGDMVPSPSKLARISSNVNPGGQSRASRYVAPDTPIHRPRRVASRMASSGALLSNEVARKLPERAQSATSTPLKGVNSSSRSSHHHHRHHHRRGPHKLDRAHISVPLPPPPPPIPIGRRLSSSAKRFIDGSLRSLYGGYSASDVEPEEAELLVSGRNFKAKIAKELLRQRTVGHSQPCTPVKRATTGPNSSSKQPSDLSQSLRAQLMQRLRGEKSMSPVPGNSRQYSERSNQLDRSNVGGIGGPVKSGWHYNRKGHGASSLNSSGLELNRSDNSPDSRGRRHYSSSSSSPSSSLSASPSNSNDDFTDSELDNGGSRKSAHSFSTSVKDLREFGRSKLAGGVGQEGSKMRKGEQRRSRGKSLDGHRRYRRKSLCPNTSCCCAKEFKLKNRPPVWNELSQVYQLDFGGRVTQESAKNLQIDFDGKLALQFGRIDRCTYTLDYKYPFNAVQAMAIALASLTQRLK